MGIAGLTTDGLDIEHIMADFVTIGIIGSSSINAYITQLLALRDHNLYLEIYATMLNERETIGSGPFKRLNQMHFGGPNLWA